MFYYRVPSNWSEPWKRELLTDQLNGVTHRIRVVKYDDKDPKRDQLFIAGFRRCGLCLRRRAPVRSLKFDHRLLMPGDQIGKAKEEGALYSIGSGDIKIGHLGEAALPDCE